MGGKNKEVYMDSITRFSDRVDNYVKYRPDYPQEIIAFLRQNAILNSESVIADIGCGTGISAELFLKEGNVVYGVEPNREMRHAAQKLLAGYKNFCIIDGTAENTMLPKDDIDIIIAGQAFHWFDKEKCKIEFKRILKQNGFAILMWNDRRIDRTPFLRAYEDFIRKFAIDYKEVNHKNLDEKIFTGFFGKENYRINSFENFQHFDFEGLKGRILSSSYMPSEGHKDYISMLIELKKIFEQFHEKGRVKIEYDTKIYYGKLN